MTVKDKLYLFPSCIPVRGYARSIIVDTQRRCFKFIPNVLYRILHEHNGKSIEQILSIYGEQNREVIEEYIDFLSENNFVFLSSNEVIFNYQSVYNFGTSNYISNAHLELGSTVPAMVIDLLGEHNCTVLQLFAHGKVDVALLLDTLSYVHKSRIASIHLNVAYSNEIAQNLQAMLDQSNKLRQVVLTDAPQNETLRIGTCESCFVYYVSADVSSKIQCGAVLPNIFAANRHMMAETLCYSSCWHKKISIDAGGYVRPCRFAQQALGRIDDAPLTVYTEQIAALSAISKDQVDVCCDCEFRRICPDCRVFTRQPERPTAHPARCTYNPYIARWKGQPGYVPLEECGEFTDNGYFVNHDFISNM